MAWIGNILLRTGTRNGQLTKLMYRKVPYMRKIFLVVENLLASQPDLCFM